MSGVTSIRGISHLSLNSIPEPLCHILKGDAVSPAKEEVSLPTLQKWMEKEEYIVEVPGM